MRKNIGTLMMMMMKHILKDTSTSNSLTMIKFIVFLLVRTTLSQDEPVRLQRPKSGEGIGRVEIFYNGEWGTICDDSWDLQDAIVVCRQLRYSSVVKALQGSSVPDGSGKIWLDDVACTGSEVNLSSCTHNGWGTHNCGHYEDAGVECLTYEPVLLQGPRSREGIGRVEIFYNGEWGTICDYGWDLQDAMVACRQLGYGIAVKALQGSSVPDGSGKIWLDNVGCTGSEVNVSSCSHNGWGTHNCGHSKDVGVECSSLRLQGPRRGEGIGRVEIFYNGEWGTICDDGWDLQDAMAVCRQLGYGSAVKALQGSSVPDGSGKIWLDDVACTGSEVNVSSCSHNGWGTHNCGHYEDAGVECLTLRLQGRRRSEGIGRVEIFYNGEWGTICDDDWDLQDAKVACRQLGYGRAVKALQGSSVPDGSGKIWLDGVACTGSEVNVSGCSHNEWGTHNCGHSEDAGVECSSLRLQGARSSEGIGRVEIFYNGEWGTICDDGWDLQDAMVACRQLGYGSAVKALQGSSVPDGSGKIWLDNVACTGSEVNLSSCSHGGWAIHDCVHSGDAGVDCLTYELVRLQGPRRSEGIGRVDIFYNGEWGTICDDSWNLLDAKVACRQLGYGRALKALQGRFVPDGSGKIWLDDVACTGSEVNVSSCSHNRWGTHNCGHSEDAGVECSSLRLQGARSSEGIGRVEIFYNGEWGTICDDSWDLQDAMVACRQLGYGSAVKALQGRFVPDGSGKIWLDNVACTGSEVNLSSCSHGGWAIHDCVHSGDAGVECLTYDPVRLQGPRRSEGIGRVEIFYNGEWGTICDDSWNLLDAKVACRQLGYGRAVKALQGRSVPAGSGKIWLDDVACTGSEVKVSSCTHGGWATHNCGHSKDAGVECSSLRLQGPRSREGIGRVEIFYNGEWGTICDDSWDLQDAIVVCRQLRYSSVVKALQGSSVPDGRGKIWLDNVACTCSEVNVSSCSHNGWGTHNCGHYEDAGVECLTFRLHGPKSNEGIGRVEIFYNGEWGTICDDGWDLEDAKVACRQLGYGREVKALQGSSVPDGSGKIWLDDVACTGSEVKVSSCTHGGWATHNCGHSQDAGVECLTFRLQGPRSSEGIGRVELFYNGEWGTICDDGWDLQDAVVACRQLGYGRAVKALKGSSVPDGSGKIWLDNFGCTGSEVNVFSCAHNGWGTHNCGHSGDAGVECLTSNQSKICDFEHGLATSLCPWDNVDGVDDDDWTLSNFYATGSTFGRYLYSRGRFYSPGKAWLVGYYHNDSLVCLSFSYYMNRSVLSILNIYQEYFHNGYNLLLWSLSGDQGTKWKNGQVTVNFTMGLSRLIIESVTDHGSFTSLANLAFTSEHCDTIPKIATPSNVFNCSIGSFFSFQSKKCEKCPTSTYQPYTKQTRCLTCNDGKGTINVGAVSEQECIKECRPGYYFNLSKMVCTKCPRNSTQENKGQITCDVCPINLPITEKEGTVFQSDCIQNCNPGSYFNKTTLNCTKCKKNSYQPQTGKTKCFTCGSNKITTKTGAIDMTQCIEGPSHKFGGKIIKIVIPCATVPILLLFCILFLCYRRMKNKKMKTSCQAIDQRKPACMLNQDQNSEINLRYETTNLSGNEFILESQSHQSLNHLYEEPRWEHEHAVKISFEPRPSGYEEPIYQNSCFSNLRINEDKGEQYESMKGLAGSRKEMKNNDCQPLPRKSAVKNGE